MPKNGEIIADVTTPIIYDFGPHIEPIARAGYEAYFEGRGSIPWDELTGDRTFRWMLTADVLCGCGQVHPQAVRSIYLTLYDARPWSGLSKADKARWTQVRDAMVTARDAWRQAAAGEPAAEPVLQRRTDPSVARAVPVTAEAPIATLRDRLKARREGGGDR